MYPTSPLGNEKITTFCVLPSLQRYRVHITAQIQLWPAVSEAQWGSKAASSGPLLIQWKTDNICTRLPQPDRWWTREQWEEDEEEKAPQDSVYSTNCLSKVYLTQERPIKVISWAFHVIIYCSSRSEGCLDSEGTALEPKARLDWLVLKNRDSTRAGSESNWMAT